MGVVSMNYHIKSKKIILADIEPANIKVQLNFLKNRIF